LFHVADVLISAASPHRVLIAAAAVAAGVLACRDGPTAPPQVTPPPQVASVSAVQSERETESDDPSEPNYNLNIVLRGDGFGHVKFRQPGTNGTHIVYLTVRVRDLEPNTSYQLQRAVDTILDGICTGPVPPAVWLTLGKGTTPQSIVTDRRGNGTARLFRDLSMIPPGSTFDIHFRVIRQNNNAAVVLTSDCYRYTVR
jgi:hypothetical protein